MNIIIVTDYFHPSESIATQRVNSWIKYFPSNTTFYIISTQDDLKAPHFSKSCIISPQKISNNSFPKKKKKSHFASKLLKINRDLKRYVFCNYLDPRLLKLNLCIKEGHEILKQNNIDAIISTSPSFVSHLIASTLKKAAPQAVWLSDFRDLWSGNPIFPGSEIFKYIEKLHELRALKNVDIITTVSSPLAKYLEDLHGKVVHTIPNGYDPTEFDERSRKSLESKPCSLSKYGLDCACVNLIYTGTVLKDLYNLEPLYQSLKKLHHTVANSHKLKLTFIGQSDGIDRTRIKELEIGSFFKFIEHLPRRAILDIQMSANALLFLGAQPNGGKATNGVVSGKIFEYLTSFSEIIAIGVDPTMEVGKIILNTRTGVCLGNDIDAITVKLMEVINTEGEKVVPNKRALHTFRRDKQAQRLYKYIETHFISSYSKQNHDLN